MIENEHRKNEKPHSSIMINQPHQNALNHHTSAATGSVLR